MKNQFLCAILVLTVLATGAQTPGQPDLNFDGDGYVKLNFEGAADFGYFIAPYGNDIIAGGIADSAGFRKPAFMRLRSDGSYNNLMASDGSVRVSPMGLECSTFGMAVQPDNKMVVVGDFQSSSYGMVFRISGTGGMDAGFGNGGYISHLRNGKDREFFYDAFIQPDNKILVCGYTCLVNDCNLVLMRLKTDGKPDSTFGTNGFVYSTSSGTFEGGGNIIMDANGKILVAGGDGNDILVFRFNSNGTPDNSFSLDGRATYNAGFSEQSSGIAVQADGKILVSGYSYNRPQPSCIVVRFNEDGTFDNNFGNNGVVDTSFTGDSQANAMVLQPDGKILLGGADGTGAGEHILLARLNSNGTVDNSFGTAGHYVSNFSANGERISDMCLLPDGRLAGTGHVQSSPGNYDMLTAVFATGINVGVLDFEAKQNSVLVFPNPVQSALNIEFELLQEESLSISLVDLSGRVVCEFASNEGHPAGKHTRSFQLPQHVTHGHYLLTMQSNNGTHAIHVTVN